MLNSLVKRTLVDPVFYLRKGFALITLIVVALMVLPLGC
jgi:hypothetical protein